jgi:hypothetical protein
MDIGGELDFCSPAWSRFSWISPVIISLDITTGTAGIFSNQLWLCCGYPLVNVYITMEKHHFIAG